MNAKAKVGDNLLDVIVDNDIDIDGFGLYSNVYLIPIISLVNDTDID